VWLSVARAGPGRLGPEYVEAYVVACPVLLRWEDPNSLGIGSFEILVDL
jgi:hypothetical protein